MNTEIYFTIRASKKDNTEKNVEVEFMMEFNNDGTCIDGQSFNLCSGWTNYTNWHQGWTEQDDDLEELYNVIREYSKSMECEQIVAEMEAGDVVTCEFVHNKELYKVDISSYCFSICEDIE